MATQLSRDKLEGEKRHSQLKPLLDSGWKVLDSRDALYKEYAYENFNQAFGVMSRVALLADKLDHHPEWFNVYNKLHVTLATHTCSGITEYDVHLATFIDKVST